MSKRLVVSLLTLVATFATLAGHLHAAGSAHAWSLGTALKRHSAAKQLPQGFVLPSADVDVKVLSLVAADVDADGDLDIVAADGVNGSFGILVWVNDGAGRLTRKAPAQPRSLRNEPASPSFGQHETTAVVSLQPSSPALQPAATDPWLAPRRRSIDLPFSQDAASASLGSPGSRAPPLHS